MIDEGEYISPTTQALLVNSFRNRKLINPLFSLTERELEIAEMYAEGLGNLEIANKLDIKTKYGKYTQEENIRQTSYRKHCRACRADERSLLIILIKTILPQ